MTKYAALGEFLRAQKREEIPLSFKEIERLTGVKLPPSARRREWWSNNAQNSALTKVWRSAGFRSEQVDMAGRKLVFRRVAESEAARTAEQGRPKPYHPLFGALKGMTRLVPGVDLTEPADPDWAKAYD